MIECMASLLRIQERLILCMGLDGFILYPTKFVSDVASIAFFVILDAVDVFAVDSDVGEGRCALRCCCNFSRRSSKKAIH
jgi:hypothetical protein